MLFSSQHGDNIAWLLRLHFRCAWINSDICFKNVWLRERCIKNVVRNTNIVSETTQCRYRDFTLKHSSRMMKHLIKLQQDSKTDENTQTHPWFPMHTQQTMKTSAANSNVIAHLFGVILLLKGWKCLQLWLTVSLSVHMRMNFCYPLQLWYLDLSSDNNM